MNWKTVQISFVKNGSFANPPVGFETRNQPYKYWNSVRNAGTA